MQEVHPLRAYREKRSLTQSALALDLSVARETIARWENGTRKIDISILGHVASVTGIPANKLRPDLAIAVGGAR